MYVSEFFIMFIHHHKHPNPLQEKCARTGTGLNRLEPVEKFFRNAPETLFLHY